MKNLEYSFPCRTTVFIFFALLFLFNIPVYSEKPYAPATENPIVEPWRWRSFPILSGKGVRCLVEGVNGTMWFGINTGLASYNGHEWGYFSPDKDEIGMPVDILESDKNGLIYAGSSKGISVFRKNKWHYFFPSHRGKELNITCLKVLSDGRLMAGTDNGFVFFTSDSVVCFTTRAKKKSFENTGYKLSFVYLPDELMSSGEFPRVEDVLEKPQDEYSIFCSQGTEGLIFNFKTSKIIKQIVHDYKITTQVAGKKLGRAQEVFRVSDNETWLISGYYKTGIFQYKDNNVKYFKLSDKFGGDELHTSILKTIDGNIWIGGLGRLFVYHKSQWELYESPDFPLPPSKIIFCQTKAGNVWVAGLQNDVFLIDYNSNKWLTYKELNFECQTTDLKTWFLTADSRVVLNDKKRWVSYGPEDGLIDAPVKIIHTSKGQTWVAGSHQGIAATCYFSGFSWVKKMHRNLSWGIDYRAVFESSDGSLWFGASVDNEASKGHQAGVIRVKDPLGPNEEWLHYTSRDGINQYNAYGIGEAPDGKIFLGGTRLLYFDGTDWKPVEENEYLKQFINCIYNKRGQKLWVGSRHYGLFCYDGKNWKHYNTENGLSSNSIISIYAISDSNVWVATDKDFCHFDGSSWTQKVFDQRFTLSREGGDVIIAADSSLWINRSMREWKRRAFGYSVAPREAFNNFWAIRYLGDKNPPKSKILVYQEKVDRSGKTLIGWEASDNWEETPLNKLSYSYRLNGGPWSDFQLERYVTLTELKPGNYTFELRAKDVDLNLEAEPAKIKFEVAPPIWRQLWFIILILCIIAVIAYYEFRILTRNKTLAKLNHELNFANNELMVQKEEMQEQKEKILLQKQGLETQNELLEQKSKEIEELSNVRLKFFTNISHEFRTPLSLITLSVEQLRKKFAAVNDSDSGKLYDVIIRNSSRLLRLINQILEVRKIEAGALELNMHRGNLQLFLSEIVELFHGIAAFRNINLKFRHDDKDVLTKFDAEKIENIMFNLISNAIKNTPEFGSITVSISNSIPKNLINFEPTVNCDFWTKIELIDTGKGIGDEHLEKIFERFFQINDGQSFVDMTGSGIGLSYTRDIVELHQGHIGVASKLGVGTTFTIYLPQPEFEISIAEEQKKLENVNISFSNDLFLAIDTLRSSFEEIEMEGIVNEAKQKEKPVLLIVEDEIELLSFLADSFKPDFIVKKADNGLSGLEMARKTQPDIIISDVMMPQMDGIELCNQIKKEAITSHIPVILLTAKVALEHIMEGLETGADDYIEKPFNLNILKLKIKNLIAARKKLWDYFRNEDMQKPEEIKVMSSDEKLLGQIHELIEKNYAEPDFDIEQLSKSVLLSRAHFTRKIKQLTGYAPKELLAFYRLKISKQLLSQKKLTIAEVAYMTGFEHPNSFSRTFRRYFGSSPSDYVSEQ